MGYKFQFVTLAGFHALNYSMFDLAHGYARNQMSAYVELQEASSPRRRGFTAIKHQREVGTGYFDRIATRSTGHVDDRADRFDRRGAVPLRQTPTRRCPLGGSGVFLRFQVRNPRQTPAPSAPDQGIGQRPD